MGKFRAKKVNGIVVGGECTIHGWLPIGGGGLYECIRKPLGLLNIQCVECCKKRSFERNQKNRKSKKPYKPNRFRTIRIGGIAVCGECDYHGVLSIEGDGLMKSTSSDGKTHYQCRKCWKTRNFNYQQKHRVSTRPFKPRNPDVGVIKEAGEIVGYRCDKHGVLSIGGDGVCKHTDSNSRVVYQCRECKRERCRRHNSSADHIERSRNLKRTLKYREVRNSRARERRKTDIQHKVSMLLRVRFSNVVSKKTTEEMLGCPYKQVVEHLGGDEEKILGGEYHIDHIFPLSRFTFDETEGDENHHKEVCFNWRNLQLLTAEENRAKRDLLNHATQTREVLESFREIGLDVSVADGKMVVRKTEIFCDE